jgi:hypothetical protein
MSKKFFSGLFCRKSTMSWRRVTMCMSLQIFAAYALMQGTLDAATWAYFAGGMCGVYVGGDTGEKIAKHFGAAGKKIEDLASELETQ